MTTETQEVPQTLSSEIEDETMDSKKNPLPLPSANKNHAPPTNYALQYGLVFLLVFQNSSVILTMRYSRIVGGDLYFTTTAVFLAEMLKLFICSFVMFYQSGANAGVEIIEIFTLKYMDTLKMSVPAILYVFQNNLLYVSASNLDAAVFQLKHYRVVDLQP